MVLSTRKISLEHPQAGGDMNEIQEFAAQVINNVERVIVGKREPIELLMVALLCEGHVLI
jgi:MoxR-like ATPase